MGQTREIKMNTKVAFCFWRARNIVYRRDDDDDDDDNDGDDFVGQS